MKIIRVFPSKTRATPTDDLVFFDTPPLFIPEADEVHVSVTFTWDLPRAEWLAYQWETTGLPVKIGGPATGMRGEDFTPGRYIKHGYTITSRGCPNTCWFCSVWKRDGTIRELEIKDGSNILDDNLLACSDGHILRVFEMLKKHKGVQFTGGLEAAKLRLWHFEELKKLSVAQMFFAYDGPEDWEPLVSASHLLEDFGRNKKRCYVLCGYPKDTIPLAKERLEATWKLGFLPMAMLWRNKAGDRDKEWMRFAKPWCRPAATKAMMR